MADPSTAPDSAAPPAPISFKKRTTKNKSHIRKRPATPPPASSSSSYSSSEDESGHKIKRRKANTGAITATSKPSATSPSDLTATVHAASRTGITSANDATKSAEWFDETDPSALSSKSLLGTTRALPPAADGTYRGLSAQKQTTFIARNPDAPSRSIGPIKAPTNIRTITVTDFAPDVCKDYKQTGFCGFGDNCKYLHAREDYKAGWQLDREWENVTRGRKMAGTTVASASRGEVEEEGGEEEAALEGIPFACVICRGKYRNPVVTRCGHYFCEACALGRYRKDPSCAACGSGTGGVFNVAKNLKRLLERKREVAARRRERAREAGEEVSEEEEG